MNCVAEAYFKLVMDLRPYPTTREEVQEKQADLINLLEEYKKPTCSVTDTFARDQAMFAFFDALFASVGAVVQPSPPPPPGPYPELPPPASFYTEAVAKIQKKTQEYFRVIQSTAC